MKARSPALVQQKSGPSVAVKVTVKRTASVIISPSPAKHGNPYLNRVMIPHPSMFFGRESIVKRIMRRLSSEKPQSVSIVGERRIGKSSLLNFLNFQETRALHLNDAEKCVFAFVDFQQVRSANANQVVGAIFRELRKHVECDPGGGLREDFDGLRTLCTCLSDDGYKLILLFDEFESITKNESIGPDFYSSLRSLANNFKVAFVTASGRNLKDMCVSRQISDSPFFNIFAVHYLGIFQREEALLFVTKPSEEYGIPLAPVADTILEEGGLYPFFLQIMCAAWFDFLESEGKGSAEYAGKQTPKGVLSLFREESEPHFEFVLETFNEEERALFAGLTKGKEPKPDDKFAELLERKGYIVRNQDGTLAPFGKELGLFVAKRLAG
jgi:serine/threonine-protein kinase